MFNNENANKGDENINFENWDKNKEENYIKELIPQIMEKGVEILRFDV